MKKTKLVTSIFMALAFFAMSVPAFAAENIGKVYVNIGPGEDDFNAGETRGGIEPSVGDDSKYHIDEYSVSDQSQEVRKAYTYNITIDAESGYNFSDSTDIEVYGATNVSVQKKGSNEIKIKAKTYPFHVLANPRKIKIDGKKGTWDAVPNASKYNVVIYYTNSNGDEKSTKKTVSTTNIDLRNFVDKYSDVRLSVQALKGTKDTDRFLSNSDYVFEDGSVDDNNSSETYKFAVPTANTKGIVNKGNTQNNNTQNNNAQTNQVGPTTGNNNANNTEASNVLKDATGLNEGWHNAGSIWKYVHNGQFVKGWLGINGEDWFLFCKEGELENGWKQVDGDWYYLNPQHDGNFGKMLTGWQFVDGNWYLLNSNHNGNYGAMLTGWQEVDGKWYFMDNSGKMLSDTRTPDGYYVGSDGHWMK